MYELGEPFDDVSVDPGSNILIVGPPLSGKRALAYDLLAAGTENDEGVVIVTNGDSANRLLTEFVPEISGEVPVGVVDCVTRHQGGSVENTDRIRYVASPDDMTGVGIEFSEFVEAFYGAGHQRNRVLLSSLSTLLLYSNLQTVFRFLHVFTSRVDNADAVGFYTIEAGAHGDRAMSTLTQLFDAMIRTYEDDPTLEFVGDEVESESTV